MKFYIFIFFIIVCLLSGHDSTADHLFGGNLTLTQTDKYLGKFTINLNFYADINGSNSSYVAFVPTELQTVKIFSKATNSLMLEIPMTYIKVQELVYDNEICAKFRNLKTAQFTFSKDVILDPNLYVETSGYYIVWTRCCRNVSTTNIVRSDLAGVTLYSEFPALKQNGQPIEYSSPKFELPKGDYICIRKPFSMPLGAINPTPTDELRYSIVTPYASVNTPTQYKAVVTAKPYPLIQWTAGYSAIESIKGSPALSIDSKTGTINLKTNTQGLFVFTIQCEQFRDGKFIGLVRQDFQLPAVDCYTAVPEYSSILYNNNPATEIGICPGDLVNLSVSTTTGNFNYQWKKDGINIIGAKQPTYQAKQFGNYTVVKSFKSICGNDTVSQTVKLKEATLIKVSPYSKRICKDDSINLEVIPQRNNLAFTWTYQNVIIGNKQNITASKLGIYYVKGEVLGLDCSSTDSITVTQKDSPKIIIPNRNISLPLGESRMLKVESSNAQSTFTWSPSTWLDNVSIATPVTSPQGDITYYVLVSTPDMCPVKDSLKVSLIRKIYIPNAFSPNDDGMNDKWEIFGINQFPDNQVYIYNRWGELIFYAKGYNSDWDGKYRDSILPIGEYVYEVKNASTTAGFIYAGHLSVIY